MEKRNEIYLKNQLSIKKLFGPGIDDAYQNMKIISYCYKQNKLIKWLFAEAL